MIINNTGLVTGQHEIPCLCAVTNPVCMINSTPCVELVSIPLGISQQRHHTFAGKTNNLCQSVMMKHFTLHSIDCSLSNVSATKVFVRYNASFGSTVYGLNYMQFISLRGGSGGKV